MADFDSTIVSGVEVAGYRAGTTSADPWFQKVVPVRDRITSYSGRAGTFKTAGNAATATQHLLSLFNTAGSAVIVAVNRITVDMLHTAAAGIAPTVVVPVIRVKRITAASAGTTLTKVARGDSAQTSAANVEVRGGTASDAGALTAITATVSAGMLAQKYSPRIMVVGTSASTFYEPVDTIPFFYGEPDVTIKAGEGIIVSLEGHVAAGNPAATFWVAEIDWDEYTRP